MSNAKAIQAELAQRAKNLEARKSFAEGQMKFFCIKARNERVEKKILSDMKRKRTRFQKKKRPAIVDEPISILPVSSNSFWDLKKPDSAQSPGFPAVNYTGIPALSTWIRRATIPARQNHALSMLHRLNAILNVLWTWSMEESLGSSEPSSTEAMLQDLCAPFKENLRQVSRMIWVKLADTS